MFFPAVRRHLGISLVRLPNSPNLGDRAADRQRPVGTQFQNRTHRMSLHFFLKFSISSRDPKDTLLFHKNWWEFRFLITRRTLFGNGSYILPTKLTLILQAVIVPIHFGPFKGTWQALIIGHHDVSSPPLSIHKRKEWLAGSGASDGAKNLEFPKHDETEGPQRRLFQTEGQSPEHSHKGVQVQ